LNARVDASALNEGLHLAHVTLTPDDSAVVVPEKLVVGVWKSSSNLTRTVRVPTSQSGNQITAMVTDPVRPYAYVSRVHGVEVFHVHTGRRLPMLDEVTTKAIYLAISDDGSQLFSGDNWQRIIDATVR
jgi:hypothetical protein